MTGATLRKAIAERVNMADSVLHTDHWSPYNLVGQESTAHERVDHSKGEHVRV